jgi:hypothetical protein
MMMFLSMADYHPKRILGKWREGFALDIHIISSIPIGHNEYERQKDIAF